MNKTLETVKWISEYAKANNVPILAYVGEKGGDAAGFIIENMDGKNAEQFCKMLVTHYDILIGVMAALNSMSAEELVEVGKSFAAIRPMEVPGTPN